MKFLLTKELGRLARWLRILGFDSEYFNQERAGALIIKALRESRIIITRNHKLPQARGIKTVLLRNEKIHEQLIETLGELHIKADKERMFSRCIICNHELEEVSKKSVRDKVPEYVFKTQENFVTCPRCNRIYWQGTHWGNVNTTLEKLKLSQEI
ncbi:MAG: hypothetical protein DRP74_03115 [Candidatus Omnitrophota bacterium]|nr:MAG: hypothetical protein DRP74_03115 [Candidatus Omnitrophota bacterium]